MINFKQLIFALAIPLVVGFLGGFVGDSMSGFSTFASPSYTPPNILFPIVWSILYILMGISSYIIYQSSSPSKSTALTFYGIQLIINAFWPLFFFKLHWFLFSAIWILLLIIFVILMIYNFYKIKPIAAYLQIPYLLWLIFAFVLNLNVYLIN